MNRLLRLPRSCAGRIIAVPDEQILAAQRLLASEGVWVEPASAAGLAGMMAEKRAGRADIGGRVVLVCTGHGLKDPAIVTEFFQKPRIIPANLEALMDLIGD